MLTEAENHPLGVYKIDQMGVSLLWMMWLVPYVFIFLSKVF